MKEKRESKIMSFHVTLSFLYQISINFQKIIKYQNLHLIVSSRAEAAAEHRLLKKWSKTRFIVKHALCKLALILT